MSASRTTITNNNQNTVFEFTNGLDGVQNLSSGLKLSSISDEINGFYIIPLVSGSLTVKLVNQDGLDDSKFEIPSSMIDQNLGKKLPFKIKEVLSASTLTSALIVW